MLFKRCIINVHNNASKLFCKNTIWLGSFPVIVLEITFCLSSSDKTRWVNLLKSLKVKQQVLVFIKSGSVSLTSASSSGFRFIRGYSDQNFPHMLALIKALEFISGQLTPDMVSRLESEHAYFQLSSIVQVKPKAFDSDFASIFSTECMY